jgi:hypothetical protein
VFGASLLEGSVMMNGWNYVLLCTLLAFSFIFIGSAGAQEGDLLDTGDMEVEVVLEWESLDSAELRMSMTMYTGEAAQELRGYLDDNEDGKIEEDEIATLESLFDDNETEEGPLGLEILIDNKTAQTEYESGWTGLLGDVDSDEPIGMEMIMTYLWSIDEDLERHTIVLESSEEEGDDDNTTVVDDDDDDDEGLPFNMTFEIKFPGGWEIDIETVIPEMMKQYVVDDNTIELSQEDMENIGEPEGDIVSFDIVKGSSDDSPLPVWLPIGALLIGALSIGLLRKRRH